jgi:hypothetical protein
MPKDLIVRSRMIILEKYDSLGNRSKITDGSRNDAMNIEIDLPEDVVQALEKKWGDLSQYATEILAVEGYRSGVLTAEQLHRMLSARTQLQLEAFLAGHGVSGSSDKRRFPSEP